MNVNQYKIPKRAPSVVIPVPQPTYITADKTTCVSCTCFPKEQPYNKRPKLLPCIKNPLTLYELTATIVDRLSLPPALKWSVKEVAWWISVVIGLPQYKACILENNINGMRLLTLTDPMRLPNIKIYDYDHIKLIVNEVHKLYALDFIKFARSIGLPPRKLPTIYTHFKSKTGPSWGIRENWKRCDVLRWMNILDPEPVHLDHWDLVWYQKPEFPKTLFGRVDKMPSRNEIPHYRPPVLTPCMEYQIRRKFKLDRTIPSDEQFIWIEISPETRRPPSVPKIEIKPKKESRLYPKPVCLEGLTGKEFILARRLKPKEKFENFRRPRNEKKIST